MQPVTVALSPTGISYLLQTLLGAQIAKALENNITIPDYNLPVANFSSGGGGWGTTSYYDISIQLTNGALDSFTPKFTNYVQSTDNPNQFSIVMTALNAQIAYTWTESYTSDLNAGKYTPPPTHSGPNTYGFTISLPDFIITATFALAVGQGGYQLTYVGSSANPGNQQPNIPSGSVVNQQSSYDCGFKTRISDATAQQLESIDYGSLVGSALSPIFASIADSGKLGPVTFDFLAPGDAGLVFPSGGGIQIGASGTVSANGSPFPGTPPADLPLPPIPTGNPASHARYFIQDYEIDALCWGFYTAGILHTTLASGDLSDPQALRTETYRGSSLNILAMTYPNHLMTAGLTARAAPTVVFTTIYQITAESMTTVQAALGTAVWAKYGAELTELVPGTYSCQAGFETQLQAIDPALMTYAAPIEKCIALPGIIATHTVRCVLNVLQAGTPLPVITFDVAQTFAMQALQLGASTAAKTQSLVFTFVQPDDIFPVPAFVSSTLHGIDKADFGDVWDALRPNWQITFAAIGTAGVPLPRIPGFEFLFDKATVSIEPATPGVDGYVSITTDLSYSPEALSPAVKLAIA